MLLTALLVCTIVNATPLAPAAPAARESVPAARVATPRWSVDEILDALRTVETGGEKRGGRHAVGDGGAAIGPYQIHRAYWTDAKLPGRYEDCRDPRYARSVVLAYWKRYCADALARCDAETLARTHNGGPRGSTRAGTIGFWKKVERALVENRARREAAEAAKRVAATRRG